MQSETFKALVLTEEQGEVRSDLQEMSTDALPDGDVLVKVHYSSLNYKDGLAVTGRGKVIRSYPMVPGIDLSGTVVRSDTLRWKEGDEVIVTGWGIGERRWGGYSGMARVKSDWLVALPSGLTLERSMAFGSAGFTAMLCVMALEEHGVKPGAGEVVVTGAAGGVGSVSVAILACLGYRVVASSGRAELIDYLKLLGAVEILDREELSRPSQRPLESSRWTGAIDNVGGATLAGLLRTMATAGSIAACGNAGGNELVTTVLPFILRGVNLLGIDSNYCPIDRRRIAWSRLANLLPAEILDSIVQKVQLRDVPAFAAEIVEGRIRGRVVIEIP